MESRRPADDRLPPEAVDFIRFCYRRRRAGWPELYDEMCAVAGRGLYRGWGLSELAEVGIGFSLRQLPQLAELVGQVTREETEPRDRGMASVTATGRPDAERAAEQHEPRRNPDAALRRSAATVGAG